MLPAKTQKNDYHCSILHIRISLSINFQHTLTIAIFWTKFAKKGSYFKIDTIDTTDKIDTTIKFCVFELPFVSNFNFYQFPFEQKNLNFWTKFSQERYLWSKTKKIEHHH